MYKHEEKDIYV